VNLRKQIYAEFGDSVFNDFSKVRSGIEAFLEAEDEDEESEKIAISSAIRKRLLDQKKWERDETLFQLSKKLLEDLGEKVFLDHNEFIKSVEESIVKSSIKISSSDKKNILRFFSWRNDDAPPVIKKIITDNKMAAVPLFGSYNLVFEGKPSIVQFEADPDLSDFENVPLTYPGGIVEYFRTEVEPYSPDSWIDEGSEKIGYEISFNKYFYNPVKLRPLEVVEAEILELMKISDGLVAKALGT
jgi:type I restriction enzyme M protein